MAAGPEPKPRWRELPAPVRAAAGRLAGAPIVRGMRVWGGYGPTATFRLHLHDGRRVFVKACPPGAPAPVHRDHRREVRVYRELGPALGPWMPALVGSTGHDGWDLLVLEDLGGPSVPPWTPGRTGEILAAYARFHEAAAAVDPPAWLDGPERWLPPAGGDWSWADRAAPGAPDALAGLAGLAGGRSDEAGAWLTATVPELARAGRRVADPGGRRQLLHFDTRSDNLRWRAPRLVLLDWPLVVVGAPEVDLAFFVQSIAVEGGPPPEESVARYAAVGPVADAALDAAVAAAAGFFAARAWRPELPGLPRLRTFQRQQLVVTLRWAADRLALPDPDWVDAVAVSPG